MFSLSAVIAVSWSLTGLVSANDLKPDSYLTIPNETIQIDPEAVKIDPGKILVIPEEKKPLDLKDTIKIDSKDLFYNGPLFIDFQLLSKKASLRWATDIGVPISTSPAVGPDGTVYFGAHDKGLYAISPQGVKKWTLYLGGKAYAAPVVGPDGTIYVITWDDQKLVAVAPNGYKKWEFKKEGSTLETMYPALFSSPAIGDDGTIYAGGFDDRRLYAITPAGKKKWSFSTIGYVGTPAIEEDGTIYFSSNHYYLREFYDTYYDPYKKHPWKQKAVNGLLYAVSPKGTKKWEATFGGNEYWRVYLDPANGNARFNTVSGKYLSDYDTRYPYDYVKGADGSTYQQSQNLRHLVIAKYPDGELKWKFSSTGKFPGDKGYKEIIDVPEQKCSVPDDYYSQYDKGYGVSIDVRCPPAIADDGTVYAVIGKSLYAIGTVAVSSISLNKKEFELQVGKSEELKAYVIPYNATNQEVIWSSSNTKVAVVDNTGKVMAIAPGKAKMTVTTEEGGFFATALVTVTAGDVSASTSVTLNKSAITLVEGESEALIASATGENAADKQMIWVSTNSNIAEVDNTGKVTAVAPGNAIIVAISGAGGTAVASVTVMPSAEACGGSSDASTAAIDFLYSLQPQKDGAESFLPHPFVVLGIHSPSANLNLAIAKKDNYFPHR